MYTCPCFEQRFLFNSCDGVCFQVRSRSFHIARKYNNGMFFQKHQSQNAIRISERHFFLLEFLGIFSCTLLRKCHFFFCHYFYFEKCGNQFFCCPHHISGHGYPKSYPGYGTWGRCVVINAKINYRSHRQPITGDHLSSIICQSAFKCNFLVLFAMPNNV